MLFEYDKFKYFVFHVNYLKRWELRPKSRGTLQSANLVNLMPTNHRVGGMVMLLDVRPYVANLYF